ncbi:MAG: DUF3291 domain-containing protein [Actinomycetota bacterium]|nr:DUF3291 domain-containing protein [Actinomycetota bacterium]
MQERSPSSPALSPARDVDSDGPAAGPTAIDGFHLAELNVARLTRPLDDAENAEFVAALGPINAIAEATPGFVWRLTDDDGQSSTYVTIPEIDDPLVIANYSIWRDVDSLRHYVYRSGHASYLRRRRDWFERPSAATTVCWWTPEGTIPGVAEAYRRLERLRRDGPSADGWPLNRPHPAPVQA